MKIQTLVVMSLALLLLVGCAAKQAEKPMQQEEVKTAEPIVDVSDIEQEIPEVETLDQDLDISGIDTLDAEIAEIEQYDFE